MKEYDHALCDFNKFIRANPENHEARIDRAAIYFYLKRYDTALNDLKIVLEKNTDNPNPDALMMRLKIYSAQGNLGTMACYEDAERLYRRRPTDKFAQETLESIKSKLKERGIQLNARKPRIPDFDM